MIKKLSHDAIIKKLKTRPLENFETIKKIERFLKEERGYVFKMPKPGSPVIVLFSGGLDSTPLVALLIEEFELQVYPIFTLRGHKYQDAELKSLQFWTKYFSDRYPQNFHQPFKISTFFPPLEIRWAYEKVENKKVREGSPQIWGDYFYSNLLTTHAAQYAYFLEITENIIIRNIFCAFMPIDGLGKLDMTLTSLRGSMLGTCLVTNDFRWQISSIPLEKEIGFFHDKDVFIRWAAKKNIPLEKTRSSCLSKNDLHCGECMLCSTRKQAFISAGIEDKTIYQNQLARHAVQKKIENFSQFLKNKQRGLSKRVKKLL